MSSVARQNAHALVGQWRGSMGFQGVRVEGGRHAKAYAVLSGRKNGGRVCVCDVCCVCMSRKCWSRKGNELK